MMGQETFFIHIQVVDSPLLLPELAMSHPATLDGLDAIPGDVKKHCRRSPLLPSLDFLDSEIL